MSDLPKTADPDEAAEILSARPSSHVNRSDDLLGRQGSAARKWFAKHIQDIAQGFEDQSARADDLDTWWNCYNCELDDNQYYNGNTQAYVPIIRDAINARATRFSNQLFPTSGRVVDCISTDGHEPWEIMALVNHYLRDLNSTVVKPLLVNGDVEGHYWLNAGWTKRKRVVVSRETRKPTVEIAPGQHEETDGEEIVDLIEEEIEVGAPVFEVLHDSDVLVLPPTAPSIDAALDAGGSVTVVRRWSKRQYEKMIEAGEIARPWNEELVVEPSSPGLRPLEKQLAKAVGIRAKGRHAMVFETWFMAPLGEKGNFSEKGEPRICRGWWTLDRQPAGLKRNPYWNDRVPVISRPREKVAGVHKGKSGVEPLAPLQWDANDAINERADADHYGAMPIVARKPGEGNKPLILNLAAVWDVDPADVQFMAFPDLSERANARIMSATTIIFQSLGVNPAMIPQQTGRPGAKRNQAEVALEQSVDLLTTAEAVKVLSEGVLDEVVHWVVDLDHQFRNRELTVRAWGEMGVKAEMVSIPPIQNGTHYQFAWAGAEQARLNVAMQQQGIAFINVVRGMAQEVQAEGYKLHIGPLLERAAVNIFGPIVGSKMVEDTRHQMSIDPELENKLLLDGHMVPVHPLDQDAQHIQAHTQAASVADPHGMVKAHIQDHFVAMSMKNRAMMAQMAAQQGAPGVPGGAGPGVAGTPRGTPPGAQPAPPRQMKGPPGMIPPEAMPRAGGVVPMPRRF